MSEVKKLKFSLWFAFFFSIALAPIDYFFFQDRYLFPFYSWELGFGRAYAEAPQALIIIESIDGHNLPNNTSIQNVPSYIPWRKRQDSKFVTSMVRDLRAQRLNDFQTKKRMFEKKFFVKNQLQEVKYKVVDRLTNLQNGEIRETSYGPYEFSAE
jgi:hypothetical protein